MEKCKICAWYCHADGKCYGATYEGAAVSQNCENWAADGLTDEEREEYAAENA